MKRYVLSRAVAHKSLVKRSIIKGARVYVCMRSGRVHRRLGALTIRIGKDSVNKGISFGDSFGQLDLKEGS